MKNPTERLLDAVEWTPTWLAGEPGDSEITYATHTGELKIGEVTLKCAVLNTGQRVFYGEVIEGLVAGIKGA